MQAATLHDAFSAHALAAPTRAAVCLEQTTLSYGDLDRASSAVARALAQRGAGVESRVGLCIERGPDMIVGLLGILKSGAAYVPIDPSYPPAHIRYIVEDSAITAVVSSAETRPLLARLPNLPQIDVRAVDVPRVAWTAPRGSRQQLAYVIYTSGSTGRPKGVLIEHGSVLRLFERTQSVFGFDADDCWAQFHSVSFDFSVWEIWGALLAGGCLAIVPAHIARAPGEFRAFCDRHRITILNQTPTAFRQFSQTCLGPAGLPPALRLVIFGGERLPMRTLEPWIARFGDERPRLVNMYGITETTVHVTHKRITAADLDSAHSPIGRPIDDLHVMLLDAQGQPVPDGSPGHLHIAGPGLARGYLNRAELTAARFVMRVDDAGRSTRYYDSGDLAMRLPSGELAYVGRADDQIKLRGYRIEPHEVECCLTGHAGVAAAVVVPQDFGPDAAGLVAYVIPAEAMRDHADDGLAARLARRAEAELPAYMRPAAYRFVSSFPLTQHGKVDRAAMAATGHDLWSDV